MQAAEAQQAALLRQALQAVEADAEQTAQAARQRAARLAWRTAREQLAPLRNAKLAVSLAEVVAIGPCML